MSSEKEEALAEADAEHAQLQKELEELKKS